MSKLTDFAIEECSRQNDLSLDSVARMVEATIEAYNCWLSCFIHNDEETEENIFYFIKRLGAIVKPQNEKGFRQTPVVFANGDSGISHNQIERVLKLLISAINGLTADEFYIEFEKIHPFEDGNGRVGAILWNLLSNNADPVCPPDFFNKKHE